MNDPICDRLCDNCESPLYRDESFGPTQYDNAMVIRLGGGYGMFIEAESFGGPSGKLIFCHDCCHELCRIFPGFGNHIQPYGSHAHTREYQRDNPDHKGWDYDVYPLKDT